jgi:hypothetical protein
MADRGVVYQAQRSLRQLLQQRGYRPLFSRRYLSAAAVAAPADVNGSQVLLDGRGSNIIRDLRKGGTQEVGGVPYSLETRSGLHTLPKRSDIGVRSGGGMRHGGQNDEMMQGLRQWALSRGNARPFSGESQLIVNEHFACRSFELFWLL